MIMGIVGKKGVGKDTAAAHLVEQYQFVRVGFADAMKQIAAQQFGWDREKDERGRLLLQRLGTEVGRAYNPNIWVERAFETIDAWRRLGYTRIVMPDVRFRNEVEKIHAVGGKVIRVWSAWQDETDHHASEIDLDHYCTVDYTIENRFDEQGELYLSLDQIMLRERMLINRDGMLINNGQEKR